MGPAPIQLAATVEETGVLLSWTETIPGDYNVDGKTNGMDLFPLAAFFLETVEQSPGNECVDGNGDGVLNGLDLFVISTNFGNEITGYNVYSGVLETGPWGEPLNAEPLDVHGCGAEGQYLHETVVNHLWYQVRAYDGTTGAESPTQPLDVWTVDLFPPVWIDTAGIQAALPANDQVTVFWNAADDADSAPVKYNIYYDTENPLRFGSKAVKLEVTDPLDGEGLADFKWRIGGLENEAPHWFMIRAEDSADEPNEDDNEILLSATPPAWQITQVQGGEHSGSYSSIAVDSGNNPIISYMNYYSDSLNVAWFDGVDWNIEELDSNDNVGGFTSLAVNPDGNPGILYFAYMDDSMHEHRFAEFDGSMWSISVIAKGEQYYNVGSLAYDPAGKPAVSLCDRQNWDVVLARRDQGVWEFEPVVTEGNIGVPTTLAFDQGGNPAIAYGRGGEPAAIDLAWYRQGGWEVHNVHPAIEYTRSISLAFDSSGYPAVAHSIDFYDEQDNMIHFAQYDGETWQSHLLSDEPGAGGWLSMTLDPNDRPAIAYQKTWPEPPIAKIATLDDQGWQFKEVDLEDDSGILVSLCMDRDGAPLMAYKVVSHGLYFAGGVPYCY